MDGDQVWVPTATSVPDPLDPQQSIYLSPNPFNARTEVFYNVPNDGNIHLNIYDLRGKKIRELVCGHHTAGQYQVMWNGKDDSGLDKASGVYLVQLVSADSTTYNRATLLK
jgi:flagellar hook assembly protein FlgD